MSMQELINSAVESRFGQANPPDAAQQPPAVEQQGADPSAVQAAAAQQASRGAAAKQESDKAKEEAEAAAAPKTEDDAANMPAFYKIKVGDEEREMTDAQIAGMLTRYNDLNFKHSQQVAPLGPAVDYLNQVRQGLSQQVGRDVTGEELAQIIHSALQARTHNPQMGGQHDRTPDSVGQPVETGQGSMAKAWQTEIDAWEEENGLKLPSAIRSAGQTMEQIVAQNQALSQQLQSVLQSGGQVAQQAQQTAAKAKNDTVQNARRAAALNLQAAQQQNNLPDEDEEDFLNFAMTRGYGFEDFVDPNLTNQVVADFVAVKSTPELERLRNIAKRRQAFTGAAGGAPGASGIQTQADPDQQFINTVFEGTAQRRNMM